jgi:hypothetical protein
VCKRKYFGLGGGSERGLKSLIPDFEDLFFSPYTEIPVLFLLLKELFKEQKEDCICVDF